MLEIQGSYRPGHDSNPAYCSSPASMERGNANKKIGEEVGISLSELQSRGVQRAICDWYYLLRCEKLIDSDRISSTD